MANDLVEITPDGKMRMHFHPGQWQAWNSTRRIVAVLAGTQGGKTTFGPLWLYREIQLRGPGDYMVVTPTYPLLELKALPTFQRIFESYLNLGKYVGSPARKFVFSEDGARRTFGPGQHEPTTVFFGHAMDPDSLESATAKAAWLDECGQKKFRLASWEAIRRRLAIHIGRALLTTTPYNLGWLKQKVWDAWRKNDPEIDVIRFDSTTNPAFPRSEFDRAQQLLPTWKFNLFYRAIFTRPAGMIYDAFDEDRDKIKRFEIPAHWPRFLGLDFGGVNTVGDFYAETPEGKLILYRTYKAGGRTAAEHAREMLKGEPKITLCVGGSKSEGQWRQEFAAGGLPVAEPLITDVEVGIDRVYGTHKAGLIQVFDDLDEYMEQKLTYSRPLDEAGEPMEGIEDKASFHYMDAERYIIGFLRGSRTPLPHEQAGQQSKWLEGAMDDSGSRWRKY